MSIITAKEAFGRGLGPSVQVLSGAIKHKQRWPGDGQPQQLFYFKVLFNNEEREFEIELPFNTKDLEAVLVEKGQRGLAALQKSRS